MITSHKNAKKTLVYFLTIVAWFLLCLNMVSSSFEIQGNKSVYPSTIYVGNETDITLSVSGIGSPYEYFNPLDVILVFDNSGSMKNVVGDYRLSSAKLSANAIINNLDVSSNRVGLVSFSVNPRINNALTSNYDSVRRGIDSLRPCGKTNIGDAIKMASQQFGTSNNSKIIVLISDGMANLPEDAKRYAIEQAGLASQRGIKIYSIGIGSAKCTGKGTAKCVSSSTSFSTMVSIANAGDGLYYHFPFSSDVATIDDVARWILENAKEKKTVNAAGKNIIISDVLEEGVVPISLPTRCNFSVNDKRVYCIVDKLDIGETKTFSFRVAVYNSSLKHLNKIAYVNYSDYNESKKYFELNNPIVTILEATSVCGDRISPVVNIVSPLNKTYIVNTVSLNIHASDANLGQVWYVLNGAKYDYTSAKTLNLPNGNYYLIAYANDSCGNIGSDDVYFKINYSVLPGVDLFPVVNIISPLNVTYNTSMIFLNITARDDKHVDSVWYLLNGVRYDYNGVKTLNLTNGNYYLIAYANDSIGQVDSDSIRFVVDFHSNDDDDDDDDDDGGCKTKDCKSCSDAPVNDFDNSELAGSISMDNYNPSDDYKEHVIVSQKEEAKEKTDSGLILNMLLLIGILSLLLIIVLAVRK